MRTFDYRHLPRQLFDGKVGNANVRLYQDKGKLDLLKQMDAAGLTTLEGSAHFDNVEASTRIEGLYIDSSRTRELLEGATALTETEAQVIGYSNALRMIESVADMDGAANGDAASDMEGAAQCEGAAQSLDVSTATILALYETLYKHRNLGRKSRYRKKDYAYVQVDGHLQAMPVSPITAFETPLVLGGACDSLAEAFNADACSPLILSAVFTVDFLCIRPFDEGNGRIARLFAELLLEKAGFDVFRYVSIDRIIEKRAMEYYDALNACVEKWDRGLNNYEPYVRFWLKIVHEAYEMLFALVDGGAISGTGGKSERVRLFVKNSGESVTKRQIKMALSDVSEATIEAALGKMVKEQLVEKLGAGRSTAYRWIG